MTICRDQIRTRSRDLLYDWHTQAVTLRRPIPTRLDEDEIGDEIVSGYTAMPQTREELAAARVSAVALLDAASWSEYESTPSEPS